MPLTLLPVETEAEFAGVVESQWASYENPLQSFFRMFCPLHGEGAAAREESLKESTKVQWQLHVGDEKSHWIKAIDANGKTAGAALWKICPKNPFEDENDGEVFWYPPGEARDYVAQAIELFDAPHKRMAARPQVYLNILFTHPEHRRRGVADLLLRWGIRKADEMGLEMWLDATYQGVPLYKRYGFNVVNHNLVQPKKESPGEVWKKTEKEIGVIEFWQMWRPVGGLAWDEKEPKPWE